MLSINISKYCVKLIVIEELWLGGYRILEYANLLTHFIKEKLFIQ